MVHHQTAGYAGLQLFLKMDVAFFERQHPEGASEALPCERAVARAENGHHAENNRCDEAEHHKR
jgi:hypothetical protein